MKKIAQSLFTRKKLTVFTLNLLFLTGLLYWLFHNINSQDLITQIINTPLNAIFVGLSMNIIVLLIYSKRLSVISGGDFLSCFLITTLGFTFNSLAPFRIGEALKIYFGKTRFNYSIGALSASILIEKIYDMIALVIFSIIIMANIGKQIIDPRIILSLCIIIFLSVISVAIIRTKKGAINEIVRESSIFRKAFTEI